MMEAIFGPFLGHFSWISEENIKEMGGGFGETTPVSDRTGQRCMTSVPNIFRAGLVNTFPRTGQTSAKTGQTFPRTVKHIRGLVKHFQGLVKHMRGLVKHDIFSGF